MIGWQLARSMFEHVTTVCRAKLDHNFHEFGTTFLEDGDRDRVLGLPPEVVSMPDVVQRCRGADEAWAEHCRS